MSDNDLDANCRVSSDGFSLTGRGGGLVVHYAGLPRSWRRCPVQLVSLETFAGGHGV